MSIPPLGRFVSAPLRTRIRAQRAGEFRFGVAAAFLACLPALLSWFFPFAAGAQQNGDPTFAVALSRPQIEEGQSATLTVAITNGVTFADDREISLSVSGTASSADYTLGATTLTLEAAAEATTTTLRAVNDQIEEGFETITVEASLGAASLGEATATIHPSDPKQEPSWTLDPIKSRIHKRDFVIAVEKFVQAPLTTDQVSHVLNTDARARIRYLKPVPGGRLAFNDLRGVLYMTDEDGATPVVYLDLREEGLGLETTGRPVENGLLGFAFHPEFAQSGMPGYGKLYTSFTATNGSGVADYLDDIGFLESVLREWTATDHAANVFAGSSREVLRIGEPETLANFGDVAFNRAAAPGSADFGMLYVSNGDGGGIHDAFEYAQDLSIPLGAILRIDPLGGDGRRGYGIPEDNPFVGNPSAAPEIWAYGLRHPQHFSFDSNGRMYINDIGENQVEEINIGRAGGNYGWGFREGVWATQRGVDGSHREPVYTPPRPNRKAPSTIPSSSTTTTRAGRSAAASSMKATTSPG